MSTVVVSGAIANKYLRGGSVWVRLSYALGFRQLGFSVYLIEQLGQEACTDAEGRPAAFAESASLAYFRRITEDFGFAGTAALVHGEGEETHGLSFPELRELCASADLLVNISGHLTLPALKQGPRRKVYLDLDPGYTQLWHAAGLAGPHLDGHDFYFTVGENIGTPACSLPTSGLRWRRTRPPVVLEHWPACPPGPFDRFTTVASWRGAYGVVEHDGRRFGLKAHEFRKLLDFPTHVPQVCEVALDIHPDEQSDLALLRRLGWRLADPRAVAGDPASFRRYVQTSAAELSPAQGIYVETGSGWFSDRTTRYLASGKPALVQDTGFSRSYPVGEGLVPFRSLQEAVAGAERIARDYRGHCLAARALAEEYFDSDRVLGRLAEEVGAAP